MAETDLALLAHLMRRAGFGATRDELEAYAAKGYAAVVEDLLHPERFPEVEEDVVCRYYSLGTTHGRLADGVAGALALSHDQHQAPPAGEDGAVLARRVCDGLAQERTHAVHGPADRHVPPQWPGDIKTILLDLSRDPAMLDWLDNTENHKDAPNENYGRELLELFSMGVGNYSEADIKNGGPGLHRLDLCPAHSAVSLWLLPGALRLPP